MIKLWNDYIFLNHVYHQQVSSKENALDDEDLSFLTLTDRKWTGVSWFCRVTTNYVQSRFIDANNVRSRLDKFVIETFGMREVAEKNGTIKKYTGNIY